MRVLRTRLAVLEALWTTQIADEKERLRYSGCGSAAPRHTGGRPSSEATGSDSTSPRRASLADVDGAWCGLDDGCAAGDAEGSGPVPAPASVAELPGAAVCGLQWVGGGTGDSGSHQLDGGPVLQAMSSFERRMEERMDRLRAEASAMQADVRGALADRSEELVRSLHEMEARLRKELLQACAASDAKHAEQERALAAAVEHLEARLTDEAQAFGRQQDEAAAAAEKALAAAVDRLEVSSHDGRQQLSESWRAQLAAHARTTAQALEGLDAKFQEEAAQAAAEVAAALCTHKCELQALVEDTEAKLAGWAEDVSKEWNRALQDDRDAVTGHLEALDQKVEDVLDRACAHADARHEQQREALHRGLSSLDRRLSSASGQLLSDAASLREDLGARVGSAREELEASVRDQVALSAREAAAEMRSTMRDLHERVRSDVTRQTSLIALQRATKAPAA